VVVPRATIRVNGGDIAEGVAHLGETFEEKNKIISLSPTFANFLPIDELQDPAVQNRHVG
jgi:hypothetical protein